MDIKSLIWNNESRAGSIGENVNVIPTESVKDIISVIESAHKKDIIDLVDKIESEVINSTSVMFRPHLTGVFAVIRESM